MPGVAGVPDKVAVPSAFGVNVMPAGTLSQPKLGTGKPLVVTVNDPAVPASRVAESALVKAGGPPTTTENDWVASGLSPLLAVIVTGKLPAGPVGVPARVAVPSPLAVSASPAGSAPVSVTSGVGDPVVVIANDPAEFCVKSALDPLVMAGAAPVFTVIVSESVAVLPEALLAETDTVSLPAAAGSPEMVAVPYPLSTRLSPDGSVPVARVIAGAG